MEEIIRQARTIQNDHLREWRSAGRPVVGYSCVATPVEVMEAAGALPYRLRALGNPQTDIADAHLSRFNCGFCRSLLQLGLDGTYDFLDGLIETNGCDHLRGMFENWEYAGNLEFMHYLKVPHVVNEDSLEYFEGEIRLLAKALQERFGREVTDRGLRDAIERQDRIREKLRTLQGMRERDEPALSGAEMMAVLLAGSAVPPAVCESLYDRVIEKRADHRITGFRARLMLCGSATDEAEFLGAIEDVGGQLVADSLCYGTRAFWTMERPGDEDPYAALARMYLENLLCPRMFDDYHSRRDFVFEAVDRAKVDGVIVVHNKFCDVHGADNVELRMDLEKKGVPVLQLEKEYGAAADVGRMKTRVQAFLERIGDR